MCKKALPNNRRKNSLPTDGGSERNSNNPKNAQMNLAPEQASDQSVNDDQNEICSVCLNQIEKKSFCAGCFHSFCFNCITRWANVSQNCPVCRSEYKNILHNSNTAVKIVRFKDKPSTNPKSVKRNDLSTESTNNESNASNENSIYLFESGKKQMIGVPITNDKHMTNNIVQLNPCNENNIPEIDIVNVTRNEDGVRIITRHNYQLACAEQQSLINELILSAVTRSVEEHNETISQINSDNPNIPSEIRSSNLGPNRSHELNRLIDIHGFDRPRRPRNRRRNHNINLIPTTSVRYNLRPITGVRVNPQVNRVRLNY